MDPLFPSSSYYFQNTNASNANRIPKGYFSKEIHTKTLPKFSDIETIKQAICDYAYYEDIEQLNIQELCIFPPKSYRPLIDLVDDSFMKTVLPHCSKIQDLNLTDCINITDTTLNLITTHCHPIKTLYLSNCPNITDTGIYAIANHCTQLERIFLIGNRSLGQDPLKKLAILPHLKQLNIIGCNKVDKIQGRSGLEINHYTMMNNPDSSEADNLIMDLAGLSFE